MDGWADTCHKVARAIAFEISLKAVVQIGMLNALLLQPFIPNLHWEPIFGCYTPRATRILLGFPAKSGVELFAGRES